MPTTLSPAELAFAADGTPRSAHYDDVYHSRQGALEQARHVFVDGNDLPARFAALSEERFVILENGFGLGSNFIATLAAWRAHARGGRLHYYATELHPLTRADLHTVCARYAETLPAIGESIASLAANWPLPLAGFHRLEIAHDIALTLLFGESIEYIAGSEFAAGIDAVFLDGFAPERNPAMWSANMLRTISRACHAGATLATWCVAGTVRRALQELHWQLERRPGFAGKREMLAGRYAPPAYATRSAVLPATGGRPQGTPTFASNRTQANALVIGAGLAGVLCAERLTARGWQVTLCDRAPAPGAGASGIPSALLRPRLALDDALAARLARLAFGYSTRLLTRLQALDWQPTGVLHIALDAADAAYQRACCERHQLPSEFAEFLQAEQIAERFGAQGVVAPHGGWWFAAGGVIVPSRLCEVLLDHTAPRLAALYNVEIARLEFADGHWHALDDRGGVRARAPHVIVTAGAASAGLLPEASRAHLPLDLIRGQLSEFDLTDGGARTLEIAVCGDGHVTPPLAGRLHAGASFVRNPLEWAPTVLEHTANREKLQRLHPAIAAMAQGDACRDWVGQRAMTPDRLPYAGQLPDCSAPVRRGDPGYRHLPRVPGLHLLGGLGARGLLWAPLLAEHLVSHLVGDPLPLPRRLAEAVDPGRYYLRALRKR